MFIARVSRGRTIREFVTGVLFVPAGFTLMWMTVFGLARRRSEIWILEISGTLAGSVAVYGKEIDDLVVKGEFQGQWPTNFPNASKLMNP